jgi:hypothetical protein
MPEIAVVNASPIITLAKAGHLTLIPESYFIPEAVIQEIVKGPMGDPARQAITGGWGKHRIEVILEPSVVEWGLGPGETEVLSCAMQKRYVAVIDDRAARIAARTLGIRVIGTIGLVLQAHKLGKIKSAKKVLQDLSKAGLYLSGEVIRDALLKVTGEEWL